METWSTRLVREPGPINLSGRATGSRAVARATAKILDGADREHLLVFHMSKLHRIIGYQVAAVGTLDSAPIHAREVFKAAILASSAAICLAHNHPGSDPTPSAQDRFVTGRLREAGELLGIPLLDHIVVGREGRWRSVDQGGADGAWQRSKQFEANLKRRKRDEPQ